MPAWSTRRASGCQRGQVQRTRWYPPLAPNMNATAAPYTTADARPSAVSGASANATASGTVTTNASWWLSPRKRGRISAGSSAEAGRADIKGKRRARLGRALGIYARERSTKRVLRDDRDVLGLRALVALLDLE